MKQFSDKLFSKKAKKINKLTNKIFLSLLVLAMVIIGMSGANTSFADTTTIGSDDITINSDTTLTGNSTGGNVTVTGGTSDDPIEITLDGVTIDLSRTGDDFTAGKPAINIGNNAYVKIILKSGTTSILKGGYECAGLQQEGSSLEITGTGTLEATGKNGGAGIGGGLGGSGSNITISGGTVTATGEGVGAGIGGGDSGDGGSNITISGGIVNAIAGGGGGAGIGSSSGGSASDITISGGTVTANGGTEGAGIGAGYMGRGINIIINGGTVTATGNYGINSYDPINSDDPYSFSTTLDGKQGTAIIYSNTEIYGKPGDEQFSGIFFENTNTGTMYGNSTIDKDVELKSGKSFTIPSGRTLTIANGTTFLNNGTITNDGTLTNDGTITNNGKIINVEGATFANNSSMTGNLVKTGYRIIYHRNRDATDTTTVKEIKEENQDYTVKPATNTDINFDYTGYSFEKWTTDQAGTGTEYCTGANHTTYTSYTTDNALDLYAQWAINQYTINFDKNGATGTNPNDITNDYNSDITLPDSSGFSKTGYHFAGWNTSSDGTGTNYLASGTYTINHASDKTLYAKWEINQYTVTFDSQGGSNVSSATVEHDNKVPKPTDPTRTDYTFLAWYKESSCTNLWDFDTDKVTSNITLYAKWKHTPENTTIGSDDLTIDYDTTISGMSGGGNVTVTGGTSDDPIEITLDGVTIDMSDTGNPAIKIAANAHVKIILKSGTTSTLKSGNMCAGLQHEGSSLEITGNGTLTANGGDEGAGIGGGSGADGSNITISGGNVTAISPYGGAGIGGGDGANGINIIINGGTVTAQADGVAADIGGGAMAFGSNSFSTTLNGNDGAAIIYARIIDGKPANTELSGIIFENGTNTGTMYGNPTIDKDVKLKSGKSFTIPSGRTLTIANGTTFLNNGTITNEGTLTNDGTITNTNTGTITNDNTMTNNGTIENNGSLLNKDTYTENGTVSGANKVKHQIKYYRNHDGSDTTVVTDTKDHGQDYTVKKASHTDINLTRTGYSFEKWTTNQDGSGTSYCTGDDHTTNTSYTTDSPFDLYAQWTINQYTISFNKNGATGNTPNNIIRNYQSTITLPDGSGLSKTGYSFAGWNTMADGTGTNYSASGAYNISHASDKTLYAQWTINQYTISFDKNGATGTNPSDVTRNYQSTITLPDGSGLSKTGHSFSGWNTMADGTGTNYPASGAYNISHASNKILYAKWGVNQYTVTFDQNYTGKPNDTTDSVDYDNLVTKPANPSRTGYTFGGWYKESGCNNVWDFDADKITDHTTLYAKWGANQYTVTFDQNYTGKPNDITDSVDYDNLVTKPANPSRTGYTFGGWYKESGCNNAWDFDADKITGNKTLYAKWTPIKYEISFDKNGAIGTTPGAITADYDSTITLPSSTGLRKTGYDFVGWNTQSNGRGTNYSASSSYILNHASDKTLYAKWGVHQYTVTFDSQGGSNVNSVSLDHDSLVTKPSDPSRTGYTFGGWYKESGCNNAWDFDNDKVTSATTLYAKWTPNKYEISFNKNGATGTTPSAITVDYNSTITLPSSTGLSKTGYNFVGWNTQSNGRGTNYSASSSYILNHASDKTLYANWSNKPVYTLTYTTTTGGQITSGAAIQSVIQGTSGTQVMVVADSEYEFSGWSDGRQDNPRTDTNVQGDITVQAIFRQISSDNTNDNTNDNSDSDVQGRRNRRRQSASQGTATSVSGQVENNTQNSTQNNNSQTELIKLLPRQKRKITLEQIEYYQQIEQELKQIYPDNLVVNGRVFTDVEEDSWYAESVKNVVQNNRMVGTSESTFSPEEEMTMGMVSTMLYSMIEPEPDEQDDKDSTQPKEWYEDSMNWAEKMGILPSNNGKEGKNGKASRLIDAKEVISREQLIVTLYNFAKKVGYNTEVDYELTKYIDAFEISKDAVPAMKWAVQNGLIAGTSKNTLSPQWTVDRAQLSVIFMNFDNMLYGDK